ncbi:MAG: prepilin-type N-terminal cleavage/methylation domain-containing protein [Verrucomicrobiaceae bacterium]|nr:MAG: prepilin-type N-terminal cleavage/methylation domain-containing protein [Verrucomicrobiaceae bacterium]
MTVTLRRHHRVPGGFTLVEVMIALAIIVVLAVLAVQGSHHLIQGARLTTSMANLKSLAAANATYHADNGVFCPADDQQNLRRWHGRRSSASGGFDPADGLLAPYLGQSRSVGICPLFKATVEDEKSFESGTGGYGYNSSYIGGKPGGTYDRNTKLRVSERMANIYDPARTVMFTTTAYARTGGLQEYAYCEPPFWDYGSGPSGDRPSPTVHFRANGKALVAWCDGHLSAERNNREDDHGTNPHGGDSHEFELGWFGPEEQNGYWNPRRR